MLRHDDNRGITAPTTNFIMNFANSIGIPVIAWIGDNSGLAQVRTPLHIYLGYTCIILHDLVQILAHTRL